MSDSHGDLCGCPEAVLELEERLGMWVRGAVALEWRTGKQHGWRERERERDGAAVIEWCPEQSIALGVEVRWYSRLDRGGREGGGCCQRSTGCKIFRF